MFLRVIGNSHRKRRLRINVFFTLLMVALMVLGAFTIKKNTYVTKDKYDLAQEIATNFTQTAMETNSSGINFTQVLWAADVKLVNSTTTKSGDPERDVLLVVNLFIGVYDDVYNKDTWYVVLFTFVGSLLYGWNVLRLVLWIDQKFECFLDDVTIYENLGDENEFTDFVLDLRNQRRIGKPVEIKSTVSTQYDIKKGWDQLAKRTMKAFLPIAPSLFYCSLYATCVFLLACYHTWMRDPHEISENMRAVSNYAAGLEASMISGTRDINSYVFVIWGIGCQILFFLTCYRGAELFIRIYCALIGKGETVRPAFLDSIREDVPVVDNNHQKHE